MGENLRRMETSYSYLQKHARRNVSHIDKLPVHIPKHTSLKTNKTKQKKAEVL